MRHIKKSEIGLSLLFFLFFFPASYVTGNIIASIKYWFVVMVFVASLLYGIHSKTLFNEKTSNSLLFLFFWVLVVSTIVNFIVGRRISLYDTISYFTGSMSLFFLCKIGYSFSERSTLKSYILIGFLMCSLNALTIFMYFQQGGLRTGTTISRLGTIINNAAYYLLGHDNGSYFQTWTVIVAAWYYYFKYKRERFFYFTCLFFSVFVTAAYFVTWSAMAAFSCTVITIVSIYYSTRNYTKHTRALNIRLLFVIGILFSALLSMGVILPFLLPMIKEVFGKNSTLSARTMIWERVYYYVEKSPIIGYGCELQDTTISKIIFNHAHNMFLEILYRGGAIGLGILICYIHNLKEWSAISVHNYDNYLALSIFIFLLSASVEFAFYRYNFIAVFLILSNTIIERQNSDKNVRRHSRLRITFSKHNR